MAEQLPGFNKPLPKNQRYDWDKWMRPGTSWRLVRGLDYDCSTANLRIRIGQVAKERGLKATSYIEEVMLNEDCGDFECLVDSIVFTTERAKFSKVERLWMTDEEQQQQVSKVNGTSTSLKNFVPTRD